jgi:uncharacterized protein (TIGR04255 family)
LSKRFSSVLAIDQREGMIPFQERARRQYPLFEQATAQGLQMDIGVQAPIFRPITTHVWRLMDPAKNFVVSLTSDAITLETKAYPGRADFMARWTELLGWVEEVFAPGLSLRLGIRYLNRLSGDDIDHLPDWVIPNLIGVALPEYRAQITQAISEANVAVEEGQLLMRWGILPPNVTIAPGLLDPVPSSSWLLDLDASREAQAEFRASSLAQDCERLSERAYSVFRWAVTETGLKHFERV